MAKEKNNGTRMLYKHPGKTNLYDGMYDYIIVEDSELTIGKAEKGGWCLTPEKAKKASEKPLKKEGK